MDFKKSIVSLISFFCLFLSMIELNSCKMPIIISDNVANDVNCLEFNLLENGKEYSVNMGKSRKTSIEIPSTFQECPVVEIEENGFSYHMNLKRVVLPKSIRTIGNNAFKDCKYLTDIILSDSLIDIGNFAFEGCDSLNFNTYENLSYLGSDKNKYLACIKAKDSNIISCELNDNAKIIAHNAFSDCMSLENVIIPDGIINVHSDAFPSNALKNIENDGTYVGNEKNKNLVLVKAKSDPNISTYSVNKNTKIICDSAFSGQISLTEIKIHKNVEHIGKYAFVGCRKLEKIIVENGNEIYDSRNDCNAVIETRSNTLIAGGKNSTIPKGIEIIGDSAFHDINLHKIAIPESVIHIGYAAFSGTKLTQLYITNGVKSIAKHAFTYSTLENVRIPNGLKSLGDKAFYGCPLTYYSDKNCHYLGNSENRYLILMKNEANVGNFEFQKGTKFIYNNAFLNCYNLNSIELPNGLLKIGSNAFSGCKKLKSITIPASVTDIGLNAFFQSCVETIKVDKKNLVYDSRENCNAIVKRHSDRLVIGCKNTQIVNGIKTIGEYAFYGCFLEKLIIPDSVEKIENSSFEDCLTNDDITIGDGVTYIGDHAFFESLPLEQIELTIGKNVKYIGKEAFYNKKIVGKIVIPDNIEYIDDGAFSSCGDVNNIEIGSSVKHIGNGAFFRCSSLENIVIPKSVTSIGNTAFSGCSSLISVKIPNKVTSIGNGTFDSCTNLKSVTIPKSVTYIGENAFKYCESLENVYYEGTIENWCNITFVNSASNPMYYASNFYMLNQSNEWYEVTEIYIPNSITNIGDNVFCGFNNVTRIEIPESVTSIGNNAFWGCSSLINIEITNSVTSIGFAIFFNCSSLINIVIPGSIGTIENNTFSGCKSLEKVTILNGVYKIYSNTFSGCKSLKSIVIPSSVSLIGNCVFTSDCEDLVIYCEVESKPMNWFEEWASKDIPVYWAGEWKYDLNGNPTPLV